MPWTERDEAAPLVLPQAMACGLPVIASIRGGITEVIDRPGENGLLVPPGDVSALVEAATFGLGVVLSSAAFGHLDRVEAEEVLDRLAQSSLWVSARVLAEARAALDQLCFTS